MPLLTFLAAPADFDPLFLAHLLGPTTPPLPTPGPWCLVRLYPTLLQIPREDLGWLGDYERCMAWAWLDVPRTEVQ